jgi:hypothetical protein
MFTASHTPNVSSFKFSRQNLILNAFETCSSLQPQKLKKQILSFRIKADQQNASSCPTDELFLNELMIRVFNSAID